MDCQYGGWKVHVHWHGNNGRWLIPISLAIGLHVIIIVLHLNFQFHWQPKVRWDSLARWILHTNKLLVMWGQGWDISLLALGQSITCFNFFVQELLPTLLMKMHKYNHYVEDLLGKSPIASMAPTTNLISQLWAYMNITCIPTDPTIESWCMLMTYSMNVNVLVTEENCGPCKHHDLYLTKSNHGIPFKNLLAVWVFLL